MSGAWKKGCVGCLIPSAPGCLIALLLFFGLVGGIAVKVQQDASPSPTPQSPGQASICGTSDTKVPEQAVPWLAEAEKTSGITSAWFAAIAERESDFDPGNFTPDHNGGTWGLFQINREEWASVYPEATIDQTGEPPGITDPLIHAHYGGIYFKNRLEVVRKLKAKNPDAEFAKLPDLEALTIAHNGGEGSLKKYPNLSPITTDYLKEIRTVFHPKPCTSPLTPGADGLFGVDDYAPVRREREGLDDWSFYWGECVSYAAWMVRTHTPHTDFNNTWRGGNWDKRANRFGDANGWDERARAVGVRVDQTPAVGAIAQHNRNTHGHVAYIAAVHENGTFDINEYNHAGHHIFGTRKNLSIPEDFDNVIHFEEP